MSQKTTLKPLAIALGAAFATSLAATPVANAAENPFAMSDLSSGYMVAGKAEGKCGEGKCGTSKMTDKVKEAKCGEGKCGADKMTNKATEGKCGEGKCGMMNMDADGDGSVTRDEFMKGHEAMFNKKDTNSDGVVSADEMKAKCGEGKCGASKMMDKAKEGKCGEGKCGGNK